VTDAAIAPVKTSNGLAIFARGIADGKVYMNAMSP
jgi:hypothetical protein